MKIVAHTQKSRTLAQLGATSHLTLNSHYEDALHPAAKTHENTLFDDTLQTDDAQTLQTHCDDTFSDDTMLADDAQTLTTQYWLTTRRQ